MVHTWYTVHDGSHTIYGLLLQLSNTHIDFLGDGFEVTFYHFGTDGFERRMKGPDVYRLPTPFSEVSTNFEGETPVFTFYPFFFAEEGIKGYCVSFTFFSLW